MSVSSRLLLLALAAVGGLALLQLGLLGEPPDVVTLALRQFDATADPEQLRSADTAKNWLGLCVPAALLALAALLFWDDVERAWKRREPQMNADEHRERRQ